MPPHVVCGLRGPPSWAWQECNRLLRLGRPWGAVTLSRCCVSGDRGGCSARRSLKPKFYKSTQTMVTTGIFPFKENSQGRAGNRTRDLMISSQRLWPVDHEAGLTFNVSGPFCKKLPDSSRIKYFSLCPKTCLHSFVTLLLLILETNVFVLFLRLCRICRSICPLTSMPFTVNSLPEPRSHIMGCLSSYTYIRQFTVIAILSCHSSVNLNSFHTPDDTYLFINAVYHWNSHIKFFTVVSLLENKRGKGQAIWYEVRANEGRLISSVSIIFYSDTNVYILDNLKLRLQFEFPSYDDPWKHVD